ncbi:MAG TPA: hypothetical protein VFF04_01775 [Candidatus Babeliales bacterium]|nr:hypothetical protein [Candidatus Babeliales bacterium]
MKIIIIGNAGSGKSNLGLTLHKKLGIPLYHLDQYFWKPGWVEPDRTEFEKIHNKLCDQKEWIIEGMAIRFLAYRIQKTDIVIFIDLPTGPCFFRVLKRAIMCWGKEYFSSAPGCPERGPDWKFLKFIWNFNRDRRPHIESLIQQYKDQKKIFIVRNSYDLKKVINQDFSLL